MTQDLGQAVQIEITPAMIEAGVGALIHRAGLEDGGELATLRETARCVLSAALPLLPAAQPEAS
jgi:hypothetical protein